MLTLHGLHDEYVHNKVKQTIWRRNLQNGPETFVARSWIPDNVLEIFFIIYINLLLHQNAFEGKQFHVDKYVKYWNKDEPRDMKLELEVMNDNI